MTQLSEGFAGLPVTFCGFGDLAYREWLSAPKGNEFIADRELNLPDYFEPGSIDIMFSMYGIVHLTKGDKDTAIQHLDQISTLLSPRGHAYFNSDEKHRGFFEKYCRFPATIKYYSTEPH